jgi:putative phosphoribosyl transferase
MEELFLDRADAGRRLAARLQKYAGRQNVIVLGLPRGGVPVAYEVASRLGAPLDVFLVRKLGVPGQEELAMGAIASGGVRVENRDVIDMLAIPRQAIEAATERGLREIERREREYRRDRPVLDLHGQTAILVDDGLATGSTMLAAVEALRRQNAERIVVAVPVGAKRTCEHLCELVDEVVCLAMPEDFRAVGEWYFDFSQTTDEQVCELLQRAGRDGAVAGGGT